MPTSPEEPNALADLHTVAENGDADTQVILGWMYEEGRGVVKDMREAYKWCLLAEARGNNDAKEQITRIKDYLTAAQQAEGQRWASEWKPEIPQEGNRSRAVLSSFSVGA